MNRTAPLLLALIMLTVAGWGVAESTHGEVAAAAASDGPSMDLFDAMEQGAVEAKFIARSAEKGRIILKNKTNKPLSIEIPDAFIGVPMAQMGGMGGMMGGMGGGMGGGQQSVGGGGGGNRGGRGGGGPRGGGGRGGGFNVPPEKTVPVDVPLLCLNHGLKEPSSSKPYAIRPIENFIADPAVIEIVGAYASGDLAPGAAQAAVWHLNSEVSWDELAAKLTGTKRNINRQPYFSGEELRGAMAIVAEARRATAGKKVKPRPFKLPGEKDPTAAPEKSKESYPIEDEPAPAEDEPAAADAPADDAKAA